MLGPESLLGFIDSIPTNYLVTAAVIFTLLILVTLVQIIRARWAKRKVRTPLDLSIDLEQLSIEGPPRKGPQLELYNIPVRLTALVYAPTGKGDILNKNVNAAVLAERILPGLGDVVDWHKPKIFRWPNQLSTTGFAHTFFTSAPLPGEYGRGTPWSIVAGRFVAGDKNMLVGLIVYADYPNNMGQYIVQRPGQWLDILRVKNIA